MACGSGFRSKVGTEWALDWRWVLLTFAAIVLVVVSGCATESGRSRSQQLSSTVILADRELEEDRVVVANITSSPTESEMAQRLADCKEEVVAELNSLDWVDLRNRDRRLQAQERIRNLCSLVAEDRVVLDINAIELLAKPVESLSEAEKTIARELEGTLAYVDPPE
jgi:hypothetical protein